MKLATLTSLATAAVLSFSVPALAQMGSSMSGGSMSSSSMSRDSSMTCQAMMDKANGMSQPTDLSKKAEATRQMDMAKAAMAKGNEASCKSHMKMAMHNMM
jgi:hypothetical protein